MNWNQFEINLKWIEISLKSIWNQFEMNWNQFEINLKSIWNQVEINSKSIGIMLQHFILNPDNLNFHINQAPKTVWGWPYTNRSPTLSMSVYIVAYILCVIGPTLKYSEICSDQILLDGVELIQEKRATNGHLQPPKWLQKAASGQKWPFVFCFTSCTFCVLSDQSTIDICPPKWNWQLLAIGAGAERILGIPTESSGGLNRRLIHLEVLLHLNLEYRRSIETS